MGEQKDMLFMREALIEAHKAYESDEIPVGAIVVDSNGSIIARAGNAVEKEKTQHAHAEVKVLIQAARIIGDWRLGGCSLYVTLEPCGMCIHLAMLSRVSAIIFGAASPLFGYHLDKSILLQLYKRDIAMTIKSGVCKNESAELLRRFFKNKRSVGVSKVSTLKKAQEELLLRKKELEAELIELNQEKFSDDQTQDSGDQMLSTTMENVRTSFENAKISEYKRVTNALQMIEEGTYGMCIDCQTSISKKRLALFPNATRCLGCQEAYEEDQKS